MDLTTEEEVEKLRGSKDQLISEGILIYDVNTLPQGLGLDHFANIIKKFGIILYDGSKGNLPIIHGGIVKEVSILETSKAIEIIRRNDEIRKGMKI